MLEEYAMRIPSTTKNSNYYTESNKRFTARRTQATNFIFKGGLTEEMLEHCRANLVNYYVCYGSAVVSVRNAERTWIRPVWAIDGGDLFILDECKSQDIIVDLATWSLFDADSVRIRFLLNSSLSTMIVGIYQREIHRWTRRRRDRDSLAIVESSSRNHWPRSIEHHQHSNQQTPHPAKQDSGSGSPTQGSFSLWGCSVR